MGRFKPKTNFGFFANTGGPSAGVTEVNAGDGIVCTPDPITGTGTIEEDDVSTFSGGQIGNATAALGEQFVYDSVTFPSTEMTIKNAGRISFSVSNETATNGRIGIAGLATYDVVNISGSFKTSCTTGSVEYFVLDEGAVDGMSITFGGAGKSVTCNGGSQTTTFTSTDFRIGANNNVPQGPLVDYFGLLYTGSSASGGFTTLEEFTINVTQH